MSNILRTLTRRKQFSAQQIATTDLARCLNTFDLTLLGIGATLGAGAYVIAGQVARMTAGPAVILSFLMAAIASILAGLCYAEFGARVPRAGSAYVYTFVSVGELPAFIIGWTLILEYVIGAASVARTFSGYFDDLMGDSLIPYFNRTLPLNVHTLAEYVDPMAFGIAFFVAVMLAIGVKESAKFNNVFTTMNICVLSFIIVSGFFKGDVTNWSIDADKVPHAFNRSCSSFSKRDVKRLAECCGQNVGCGEGGFMPYGLAGVVRGAATCFFAFVGFDSIATTGEEAINPQRSIPIAIVLSLGLVLVIYFGISATITLMVPYFLLDLHAPFAKVFTAVGWNWATYVVNIGAVCALSTSLLGSMFPMPRVILAMSRDGLIFKTLANVSPKFHTPLLATMLSGTLAGLMAAVFDIDALVEMMSIGTLLAYSLVAICVLLLRYDCDEEDILYSSQTRFDESYIRAKKLARKSSTVRFVHSVFRPERSDCATPMSAKVVKCLTLVLLVSTMGVSAVLSTSSEALWAHDMLPMLSLCVFGVLTIFVLVLISLQPHSTKSLQFKVPLVPWFPAMSLLINVFLMFNLDVLTWLRFGIWMGLGLLIYLGYGVRHSSERDTQTHRMHVPHNAKHESMMPLTANCSSSQRQALHRWLSKNLCTARRNSQK